MLKKIFYVLVGILLFNSMVFTDISESAKKTIKLIANNIRIPGGYETIFKDGHIFIPIRVIAEEKTTPSSVQP